jgi:hypothetical protein
MYGYFARNTLSCSRGAIGAAIISSWKGLARANRGGGLVRLRISTLWISPLARCDGHHKDALVTEALPEIVSCCQEN